MRDIINISLPQELAAIVRKEVKEKKYASISEYFRSILRSKLEDKILADLNKSQKQIASGQGKILHSLKDLR